MRWSTKLGHGGRESNSTWLTLEPLARAFTIRSSVTNVIRTRISTQLRRPTLLLVEPAASSLGLGYDVCLEQQLAESMAMVL